MEKCFVIQPFDNDKFDKRFVDIFEPAIIKAEFDAYRIDKRRRNEGQTFIFQLLGIRKTEPL